MRQVVMVVQLTFVRQMVAALTRLHLKSSSKTRYSILVVAEWLVKIAISIARSNPAHQLPTVQNFSELMSLRAFLIQTASEQLF